LVFEVVSSTCRSRC